MSEYKKGCWGRWCARLLLKNRKLQSRLDKQAAIIKAAKKLLSCFPEVIPEGQDTVEFNMPGYVVEELRQAFEQ